MDGLSSFVEMAKQAGPFAAVIMTFLWWAERSERRDLQDKINGMTERVLAALNDTKAAMHALSIVMGARNDDPQ